MIRSLGMLAFACALAVPVVSFAQQTDDGAFNTAGTYRATVPTESINPTCNGGAPGVVGKTYGGNVCPPAGGAATITASLGAFAPGSANNTVGLSATTTSSSIALGTGSTTVVTNTGTTTVYVAFGGSGVIATTSGSPVLAGSQFAFSNGSNTYMAAITGSGSAALLVTTGTGLPAVGGAGGSGGVPYTLNGDGGVPSHLTNGPTGYALESGHIATVDTNTASLAASVGAKTDASCLATDTTAEGQICLLKGAIVELKATVSALQSLGITNTAFGISGTLPGFASTPTFNLAAAPANAAADGWDVTQGSKADLPCALSTSACSVEGRLADLEAQMTAVKVASQSAATVPMGCAQIGSSFGAAANCNVSTPDTNVVGTVVAATSTTNAFTIPGGNGQATADVTISGLTASAATLIVEAEGADNSTWTATYTIPTSTALGVQTLTTDQTVSLLLAGHRAVRLRVSVAGAGNITFASNTSTAPKEVRIGGTPTFNCGTGCGGAVAPTLTVPISTSSSGLAQLVAGVAGKQIYITSWDVVLAAAGTFQLETGTGTNCGTGTAAVTGAYSFAANGGIVKNSQLAPLTAGNALCINNGSAVAAAGEVSYAQQ
jgi:hypothetical protein